MRAISENRIAIEDSRVFHGPVRVDENFQANGTADASRFEDQGIWNRHLLENGAGAILCLAYGDARQHREEAAEFPARIEARQVFTLLHLRKIDWYQDWVRTWSERLRCCIV